MACLEVSGPYGKRWLSEGPDGNVRGQRSNELPTGVIDWKCGHLAAGDTALDLDSLITDEGLMVGNVIKKVTNALGIKQCLRCKGRQQHYNAKGLELQRKAKAIFS